MTRIRPSAPAVGLLLALSGGATLAGEALGARVLRPLLGSTAAAQTGTLVGVLGFLGAGAYWSGRTRRFSPRAVLVAAHAGLALVCALGALVPGALAAPLARALVALPPAVGDVARFILAVAFAGAPGFLAGAVFPAAVALLRRGGGAGTAFAGGLSSLGAAAAALATTFALGPSLGVSRTLLAAGALLAALAFASSRFEDVSREPAAPPGDAPRPVLATLLLLGAASTAWQVLVARAGALAFGPSAFTFAAALAGHVTALAAGELACLGFVSRATAADARRALGAVTLAAALAAAAGVWLLRALPGAAERMLADGAPGQLALWATAYGWCALAALPVAGFVGAGLALAARSLGGDGAAANGRALAASGAGNVAGAALATFVAMPALGVAGAGLAAAALVGVAAGLARSRWAMAVALAAVALSGARLRATDDPAAMLGGPFLYAGSRNVELGRVAWRRDGPEATVAVRRDDEGNVLLQINGKVDATSLGDAATQTLVGMIPVAMARDPRDVLVVGLGSGMTVDAARSVPGVRRVEAAELLGDVVAAARGPFARANHRALEDARVRVVGVDAAQYLRGTRRLYDAIVSEPSNPWVAGMSDLFTRESFEAARDRLREGGAFGAWFHAYGTSAEAVASIVATFRAVFPRAALVELTPGTDYLLVGLKGTAPLDLDAFLRRADDPTLARMLLAAGVPDRASLLARFLGGRAGVAAVAGGAPVLRASDLTLEFVAPSLLYRDATADVFALLARVDDLPLAGLGVDASPNSTWLRLLDASEPHREAVAHARSLVLAAREGDRARALREGELAVGLAPRDDGLRAMVARLYLERAAERVRSDPGAAESDLTAVLELAPPPAERVRALVRLGDLALRRGDGQRALTRYTDALGRAEALGESAPEVRVRLAGALAALGAREQAAEEYDRALREARDPARRRALEAIRAAARPR